MGRVPDSVAPRVTVRPIRIVPALLLRAARGHLPATIARDVPTAVVLVDPAPAMDATTAGFPLAVRVPMAADLAVPAEHVLTVAAQVDLADPVVAVPEALVALVEHVVQVDPAAPADTVAALALPIKDLIAVSRPRPIRIVREAVLTVPALLARALVVPDVPVHPDSPAFQVSSSRSSLGRRPVPTARPRARARLAASARPRNRSKTRSSTRPSRTSTR